MKINTKILIGFLSIIVLIFAQVVITYKLQSDILDGILQVKNVEVPLEIMSEQMTGYDAILTGQAHTALLHAQKGDYEGVQYHKARYDAIKTKLDDLLKKDARILLRQSKRPQEVKDKIDGILRELDRLNLLSIDLETRAFAAIEKKDVDTAYSLIVGGDYHKYKDELYQNYKAWADTEYEISLGFQNNILGESQQIIYLNLGISIITIIMTIITMLVLRSFFARREKELEVREEMDQKYRTLFENSTEAIFIADVETRRLVDCNQSAEKLMGYSKDKLLSMKADELHPEDKIKETMEGFQKQVEGKIESVFTEVLTRDNKRIPVRVNASAVKIGNKIYNQGIFIEIK